MPTAKVLEAKVAQPSKPKRPPGQKSCPKCCWEPGEPTLAPELPGDMNARVLLDTSPSPQILLSEYSVIVYANRSAQRILRLSDAYLQALQVQGGITNQPKEPKAPEDSDEDPIMEDQHITDNRNVFDEEEAERHQLAGDIEGRTLDQLNIQVAYKDMQRWVSIVQVFENVKIQLRKRSAKLKGDNLREAELFGEIHENYDYYGSLEEAENIGRTHKDQTLRDTVPVSIQKKDGTSFLATMYISLVDPFGNGVSYSTVTFIPGPIGKEHKDASFRELMANEARQIRERRTKREEKQKMKERLRRMRGLPPKEVGVKFEDSDEQEDMSLPEWLEMKRKHGIAPSERDREKFEKFVDRKSREELTDEDEQPIDRKPEVTQEDVDYGTEVSGQDMIRRAAKIKELILDEMEFCFIALSPDGDIVITNRATKAVLGQDTLKASIGEGFEWIARLDIWRPDFSERLPFEEWALNRLITYHEPLTQVIGLYAGDFPLVVELRGSCIWEDAEKQEGLLAALAIVVNQTEWFQKEEKMRVTEMQQGSLISNIATDLQTSVSSIVSILEDLNEFDDIKTNHREVIQSMYHPANALVLMLNDIIDFRYGVENRTAEITIQNCAFDLESLVADIGRAFYGMALSREAVSFDIDTSAMHAVEEGGLFLVGDDTKIKRIVANLLANAFKHTIEGHVKLSVSTERVWTNTLDVRFQIEDTGIGMTEPVRKSLLQGLTGVSKNDSKQYGLKIAFQYVNLLGGRIGFGSEDEKGTTFWFTIPVGLPHPALKQIMRGQPKKRRPALILGSRELYAINTFWLPPNKRKIPVNISGTIVMIVEHDWPIQFQLHSILTNLKCKVIPTLNGQACIEVLISKMHEVDLIIMDLHTPMMDGFTASKMIRNEESMSQFHNIPILGLTEHGISDIIVRMGQECGLNEIMIKPLSTDDVRGFIERVMHPSQIGSRRKQFRGPRAKRDDMFTPKP